MANGIVAIYGGRFHPFHKGHRAVYDSLAKKFGGKNTFVCTSDKTGPGSPFTFKEKRAMMLLAGVPGYAIKQEVSPYKPENTLSTVSEDTAVIFAVGQKDMEENPRFKPGLKKDGTATYYQDLDAWLKAGKKLEPFEKHGYLITIPSVKFTVLNKPADSASQLRAQYPTLDDEQRKEFITDLFGAYDEVIQQVMDKRLAETTERKLTGGEKRSKEAHVKKLKKHKGDFEKRYGDDAESVMYAVATKRAKGESVEEGDIEADKKNPVAKKHIDKPEWKALHDMDDDIINDYIKHKKISEETPFDLLKRKIAPIVKKKGYQKAAERLHSVLQRKEKENAEAGKPFRHALGWYAHNIANSFMGIDTKALMKFYTDNFDAVLSDSVSENIYKLDREDYLNSEVLIQGIGRMTLRQCIERVSEYAAEIKKIADQADPYWIKANLNHHIELLSHYNKTVQDAYKDLHNIRKKGGINSKNIPADVSGGALSDSIIDLKITENFDDIEGK